MKKVLILCCLSLLFVECSRNNPKNWIYDKIPIIAWHEVAYEAVNSEYQRIYALLLDYANQEKVSYYNRSLDDDRLGRAIFGSDYDDVVIDLFLKAAIGSDAGLGPSAQKSREKAIEEYNNHVSEAITALQVCISNNLLAYCDSSYMDIEQHWFSDEEVCTKFIGEVHTNPNDYEGWDDFTFEIAENLIIRALCPLEKPVISSCTYDKTKGFWVVRMDYSDDYYVKIFKRDNGNPDYEFSTDSHHWD